MSSLLYEVPIRYATLAGEAPDRNPVLAEWSFARLPAVRCNGRFWPYSQPESGAKGLVSNALPVQPGVPAWCLGRF